MEEREGNQVEKKSDFHRVTEFQSWMEYWNLSREIFFFFPQLFILKRHPVFLNVNISQKCSTVSIAGN